MANFIILDPVIYFEFLSLSQENIKIKSSLGICYTRPTICKPNFAQNHDKEWQTKIPVGRLDRGLG